MFTLREPQDLIMFGKPPKPPKPPILLAFFIVTVYFIFKKKIE